MNNRNAWGFLSFGFVMGLLPTVAPVWFPPTGIDGTSARALWLEVIGAVQLLLGGARVLWHVAVPAFVRWLAYTSPPTAPLAPVITLDPPGPPVVVAFEPVPEAEAA